MGPIALTDELTALHDREWERLRRPGTWFSGDERVAIADAARGAAVPGPAAVAARKIYDEPATITRDWLAGLEADGLTLTEYVEVLGIVSRLRAFDTMMFGLGHQPRPLPAAVGGEASRVPVDPALGADLNGSWVPTVGPAFPPTVLSSVPTENDAMHDVHGELYLTPSGESTGFAMGNMTVVRDGLNRSQIEFVAARTSLLNDCFF